MERERVNMVENRILKFNGSENATCSIYKK